MVEYCQPELIGKHAAVQHNTHHASHRIVSDGHALTYLFLNFLRQLHFTNDVA